MGKRTTLVLAAVIGLGMAGAGSAMAGVPFFDPGHNQKDNGKDKGHDYGNDKNDKGDKGDKNNKGGLDLPPFGKGDKGGKGDLFGKDKNKHEVCWEDQNKCHKDNRCGYGDCRDHGKNCEPATVPLPAAAWSGLSTMLGGIGVAGFRKLRRKTA